MMKANRLNSCTKMRQTKCATLDEQLQKHAENGAFHEAAETMEARSKTLDKLLWKLGGRMQASDLTSN